MISESTQSAGSASQAPTTQVKTSLLTGLALDWATGVALYGDAGIYICGGAVFHSENGHWAPSTDWEDGGPLIDLYLVQLEPDGLTWRAKTDCRRGMAHYEEGSGPSALVAMCRAIVASLLGELVGVPKELV